MPLYDYQCEHCGNEFEALQSVSEEPLIDCNVCGEPRLKKLPAAPAFSFKGGGWYKDLYGSPGSSDKTAAKSDSGGKPDSASSEASKKTTQTEKTST